MFQSTLISARHFYSFFDKSTLIWDATYFSSIRFDGGFRQSFNFILKASQKENNDTLLMLNIQSILALRGFKYMCCYIYVS